MAEANIDLQKAENNDENIDQKKPETTTKPSPEDIRLVYQELCTSYRAIDEFRTKLLGFLPLATGGLFLLIVNLEEAKQNVIEPFLLPIGIFGFAIALGLFFFELYGIRKCHYLIKVGIHLESQMNDVKGQFVTRPPRILGFISEPLASGIIYPAVLAAWTAKRDGVFTPSQHLGIGACRESRRTSNVRGGLNNPPRWKTSYKFNRNHSG